MSIRILLASGLYGNCETWNLILTTYNKEITKIIPNLNEIMAPYRVLINGGPHRK